MAALDDIIARPYRTPEQAEADIRAKELAQIERNRLQNRWHIEGWRECPDHHGKGCYECDGTGQVKIPFFDWLDEMEVDVVENVKMGSVA